MTATANPRDNKTPVAWFEGIDAPRAIIRKFRGRSSATTPGDTPGTTNRDLVIRPTSWAVDSPTMQVDRDDVGAGFAKAGLPR